MSKKTKESFKELAEKLNDEFKGIDGRADTPPIPTGSISLDKSLEGGYFPGRIVELMAWEGAGKTTLCLHAIAEAQKLGRNVCYIDAEYALDKKYAQNIGVDWESLSPTLFQPYCGEDGFEYAIRLMNSGELGLLIIDSTSGMLPKKMMDDGGHNLGLHARLMSAYMPRLKAAAKMNDTAVIIVSQFREKIGVMFGDPRTTQGGHALRFYADTRIELSRSLEKELDEIVGIRSKYKVIKNKTARPYATGEILIAFGSGIENELDIIDQALEKGLITVSGRTYSYKDGTKLGAGIKKVKAFLEDNPEFKEHLIKELSEQVDDDPVAVDTTTQSNDNQGFIEYNENS